MRVLLTGTSGSGKSTLVHELRRRGYAAYDADDHGFSEPRTDGRWGWRADAVRSLLARTPDGDLLFFAGCSEEQRFRRRMYVKGGLLNWASGGNVSVGASD